MAVGRGGAEHEAAAAEHDGERLAAFIVHEEVAGTLPEERSLLGGHLVVVEACYFAQHGAQQAAPLRFVDESMHFDLEVGPNTPGDGWIEQELFVRVQVRRRGADGAPSAACEDDEHQAKQAQWSTHAPAAKTARDHAGPNPARREERKCHRCRDKSCQCSSRFKPAVRARPGTPPWRRRACPAPGRRGPCPPAWMNRAISRAGTGDPRPGSIS